MLRKDFTPSERVAIGKAVEEVLGERRGGDRRSEESSVENSTNENYVKRTDQIAAEKAGFGNKDTYRQAKTVTEKGTGELVEAMDTGEVAINGVSLYVNCNHTSRNSPNFKYFQGCFGYSTNIFLVGERSFFGCCVF